jgi:hypothetical protein
MNQFDEIMHRSGEKLNFAKQSLKGRGNTIRDDQGYSYTANRILTSIENLMDAGSSTKFMINEAIAAGVKQNFARNKQNFSASDLQSVQDVDVVDIAIGATIASHGLTYGAMERAMDSVGQNITFQGLKAVNTAGGVTAGQKVFDVRSGLPTTLDFSRNSARVETKKAMTDITKAGANIEIALATPGVVITGETKLYAVLTENVNTATPTLIGYTTGKDAVGADGKEPLVMVKGGLVDGLKVEIATGKLTGKSLGSLAAYTLITSVCYDRIAENDGAHTLKLKPFMDSQELVATENRIILQSSVEVQAQMNKILRKNSQYGVSVDFGKRAIDQVVQLYTYFLDRNVVNKLYEGAKGVTSYGTLNLSGYATTDYKSFSNTKNDRILAFIRGLVSSFLTRTGSPVTALFVDEVAALQLGSDTDNFVEDPAFKQRRDGFIGTYNNIPVVRNVLLNGKASNSAYGIILGVYKSLDGNAAPVAVGDYLPPYSTLPAINANNPGELSQALFSQTASKCVVPEFICKAEINPFAA